LVSSPMANDVTTASAKQAHSVLIMNPPSRRAAKTAKFVFAILKKASGQNIRSSAE